MGQKWWRKQGWLLVWIVGWIAFAVPFSASSADFETPSTLKASDVLPAQLLKSQFHQVDEDVQTQGFTHIYRVSSKFGDFTVRGKDMLKTRVRELFAIHSLQRMRETKAFVKSAAKAGTAPVAFARNFFKDPVDTVTGVPKGVFKYMGRVGEMVTGQRGEQEEGVGKELIGFSETKRKLASKLQVDPYSSNEILQDELNRVAWASFSGGFTVRAGLIVAVQGLGIVARADRFNKLLLDLAPEDLRKINRNKLEKMEIDHTTIKEFLSNPHYSPRHETILVGSLEDLFEARRRGHYIKVATRADSEREAFYYQRVAEMMDGYSYKIGAVEEIVLRQGFPVVYSVVDHLAILLPADTVVWSENFAQRIQKLLGSLPKGVPVKQMELWVSGQVSERVRAELRKREVVVHENAYEPLGMLKAKVLKE